MIYQYRRSPLGTAIMSVEIRPTRPIRPTLDEEVKSKFCDFSRPGIDDNSCFNPHSSRRTLKYRKRLCSLFTVKIRRFDMSNYTPLHPPASPIHSSPTTQRTPTRTNDPFLVPIFSIPVFFLQTTARARSPYYLPPSILISIPIPIVVIWIRPREGIQIYFCLDDLVIGEWEERRMIGVREGHLSVE